MSERNYDVERAHQTLANAETDAEYESNIAEALREYAEEHERRAGRG